MAHLLVKNSRYIKGKIHEKIKKDSLKKEFKFVDKALAGIKNEHKIVGHSAGVYRDKQIMILYWQLQRPMNLKERSDACNNLAKKVASTKELKGLKGVSCAFLYPQHPKNKISKLGQYFVDFEKNEP